MCVRVYFRLESQDVDTKSMEAKKKKKVCNPQLAMNNAKEEFQTKNYSENSVWRQTHFGGIIRYRSITQLSLFRGDWRPSYTFMRVFVGDNNDWMRQITGNGRRKKGEAEGKRKSI